MFIGEEMVGAREHPWRQQHGRTQAFSEQTGVTAAGASRGWTAWGWKRGISSCPISLEGSRARRLTVTIPTRLEHLPKRRLHRGTMPPPRTDACRGVDVPHSDSLNLADERVIPDHLVSSIPNRTKDFLFLRGVDDQAGEGWEVVLFCSEVIEVVREVVKGNCRGG